jgi:predicted ATPase
MANAEALFVDNYKSLVDFEFRPPRLCVLVGENASGKTNIGSAFHAADRRGPLVRRGGAVRQWARLP